MNKFIKNFKAKYQSKPEIDHVIDYLKNNYKKDEEILEDYFEILEKTNEWVRKLNQGYKKRGKTELIKDFNDGITFVKLVDNNSKSYEGAYLNHCSASYKEEDLYSLRKDGNPLYTIQLDENNGVVQVKGFKNKSIKDEFKEYLWNLHNEGFFHFYDLDWLCKILHYRYDHEFFNFIKDNNLIDHIKYTVINYHMENHSQEVMLFSTNSVIKFPKPIKEIKSLTENLFLFFVENNMCNDVVNYYIDNKKISKSGIHHIIESNVSLNFIKKLKNKGYNFDEDSLLASIYFSPLDTFKYLYEDLKIRGHWDLLNMIVSAGRISHLKYCIKKGYFEKDSINEYLKENNDINPIIKEILLENSEKR